MLYVLLLAGFVGCARLPKLKPAFLPHANRSKGSVGEADEDAGRVQGKISTKNVYRAKPGDHFRMDVYGEEDISGEFIVREDGSVRHSLLGRVQVVGLSLEEMETLFTARFAGDYLVDPKVSIQLAEIESYQIVVNGQVAKPGVYQFEPNLPMTVLTAIARAGGFTDVARESAVKVVRVVDGKETIIRVNVSALLAGKKPDVMLQADDRVWVPESAF